MIIRNNPIRPYTREELKNAPKNYTSSIKRRKGITPKPSDSKFKEWKQFKIIRQIKWKRP